MNAKNSPPTDKETCDFLQFEPSHLRHTEPKNGDFWGISTPPPWIIGFRENFPVGRVNSNLRLVSLIKTIVARENSITEKKYLILLRQSSGRRNERGPQIKRRLTTNIVLPRCWPAVCIVHVSASSLRPDHYLTMMIMIIIIMMITATVIFSHFPLYR